MTEDPAGRAGSPDPSGSSRRAPDGGAGWVPPLPEHLQRLLPQFEILSMLGRGGMGAVYKGRQISLDRMVAIKILPQAALSGHADANFAGRFKNEARALAKMNHPAIVGVYEFGETIDGQSYFVMEFVDGTDVARLIRAQGRLPADHALAITAQVCDALQYAHSHGVIHRDIKPANVLMNMEGQVKVADFGLAKAMDPGASGITRTHMALGTPDYIAPEALIAGLAVDHRADLYAVGVMLYQMLTGEVPRGVFKLPSQKVGCDPRFDAIILKAVQTERDERYQSAIEIRQALDVILTAPQVRETDRDPVPAGSQLPKRSAVRRPGPTPAAEAGERPGTEDKRIVRRKKTGGTAYAVIGIVFLLLFAVLFALTRRQPAASAGRSVAAQAPAPLTGQMPPEPVSPGAAAKPPPSVAPAPAPVPIAPKEKGPDAPSAAAPAMSGKAVEPAAAGTQRQRDAAAPAPPPAPPPAPAPIDAVAQRLSELERQYLAAYEQQIGAKHRAAAADLNAKFLAALDRAMSLASRAGNLDEALAHRNERTRIESQGTVPDEDAADAPESLRSLRKTYRATMATMVADRETSAGPLRAAYDRALGAYQDELTRAQKLDDAARVRAVRDHAAAQSESPVPAEARPPSVAVAPAPGRGATVPVAPKAPPLPAARILPPPPKATPEEVRELAEWCLGQRKGEVHVLENGVRRTVDSIEKLPKGRITLVHFYIYELAMDDEGKRRISMLGRISDLESIFFHKNPGTFPIEDLRGLTKLKSLHLTPTAVDDAAFAHLSGLKNLESLSLVYYLQQFNGTGLGYINENLRSLELNSATLNAEGLAYLPRFKKLQRLVINGQGVGTGRNSTLTDAMFQGLAALPDLEQLELVETPLDGSFLASLPQNSKLKTLRLGSGGGKTNFRAENLTHLSRLKHLEELSLPPLDPGPAGMAAIASRNQLRLLVLNNNSAFTGESLKGVKGFNGLTSLDLNVCPISDAGFAAIVEAMPQLQRLGFSKDDRNKGTLTPQGFSAQVGRLRSLSSMTLGGEHLGDAWMPALARAKNVNYLMVTGARISDEGLAPLMKLPLWYLRLDSTPVTDAVIPVLKTCPTLVNVPVGDTKMTEAGKAELQRILNANRPK